MNEFGDADPAATPAGQPEDTLITTTPGALPTLSPALTAAIGAAKTYARQAHAAETRRAYLHDWHEFQRWCAATGCPSLPADPASVAGYLAALAATLGRSALQRRLSAIGLYHKMHGIEWSPSHPAIRTTLRGIGRIHGAGHRKRPAAALTSVELKRLLAGCGDDLAGSATAPCSCSVSPAPCAAPNWSGSITTIFAQPRPACAC